MLSRDWIYLTVEVECTPLSHARAESLIVICLRNSLYYQAVAAQYTMQPNNHCYDKDNRSNALLVGILDP